MGSGEPALIGPKHRSVLRESSMKQPEIDDR